jgi:hypothetical protein
VNRITKKFLPINAIEFLVKQRDFFRWKKENFFGSTPQIIKEKMFLMYGISNSQWVETGTYVGTSTKFLANNFPFVHSIEPSKNFYDEAVKRFNGKNIKLYNEVSENVLSKILSLCSGDINFWLDGHFSGGYTYKGIKDCPIIDELCIIENNLNNFKKVLIMIDDLRFFSSTKNINNDYPSIDLLVDWARKNNFKWKIEHDIFIMFNYKR